ncbi:hypothetical protein JOB18_018101 [Solea senegalensis]|uniref:TERF1-interacting nuclear factor 2 N-terminal domain-containing protein n=1 Tax=Solea senegalensis TaxID=28829 RepID=A0AAV6QTB5_SOLSE|nr:TERF1-interacting nuclear factor 2 [Solea senegalensis]XP_043876726.1 TERF1-interacting nuclear factor 2 [Solea senegalensis]KAG7496388.1 hypothetical protein JOB18_018101 [Solea senegalensis]KAG7496389.1 hypothetical protein JOB18_018101 [Solea senegalensis]
MATRTPKDADVNLPFAALQLLAPPMRLVSAALWKVLKQRDVMQYGVVEEFVTSACETVPGMLTVRHQGKLTLGLRGRLILELCRTQPDMQVIEPHLKRIRAPAVPPTAAATVRKDVKITRTVESFHSFIHTLLTEPAERELFYKEEFPVDYGPKFDEELEKLLWEFLIRLDQLLPVPNLAQTVSWLSDTPTVLEECARSATQPQLLNILLQHQTCLGHLEPAASLPPNMGDSILESLSLPLSGRAASKQRTGATAVEPSSSGTQTRDKTPFITPVIGLISNKDIPVMMSSNKKPLRGSEASSTENATDKLSQQKDSVRDKKITDDEDKEEGEEQEAQSVSKRSRGIKRKQPDKRQSDSEQEDEVVLGMSRSGRIRISRVEQSVDESKGDGDETVRKEELKSRASLANCLIQLDLKTLCLPDDPSLCSALVSCLSNQPKVIIKKVQKVAFTSGNGSGSGEGGGGGTLNNSRQSSRKKTTNKTQSKRVEKPDSDISGLDDKENRPILPSSSHIQANTETLAFSGDGEDYVADSEDEATKNFKGRLFMKRYYKTKHGTYVPTLREFWKPGMPRKDLLSSFSKRR